MHDDPRGVVGHQLPPGRQITDFQRINRHAAVGSRELQQTQVGAIGELREEFGIEADNACGTNFFAEVIEVGLACNQDGHGGFQVIAEGVETRMRKSCAVCWHPVTMSATPFAG